MSNHKQFEPIVKTLLEELQCPIKHNGLEKKKKRDHARVSPLDRGPESYEITNQGRPFGGVDVFPAKKVEALLDDLIIKYYEHKGSVKGTLDNAQTAAANITTDLVIKDGKYLSKITDTKEGFRFHVKEGVVITEEVKQIIELDEQNSPKKFIEKNGYRLETTTPYISNTDYEIQKEKFNKDYETQKANNDELKTFFTDFPNDYLTQN